MDRIIFSQFVWIVLAFAVGCLQGKECNLPLGLSHSNTVKNSQFRASSSFGKHLPSEARLGNTYVGWCASNSTNGKEWIEINFQKFIVLTQIEIEGIQNKDREHFVRRMNLQFSYDGVTWFKYFKSLQGSSGAVGVKQVKLEHMIKAKYMRVYPEDCHNKCCLKMDAYGCQKDIKPALEVKQSVQRLSKGGHLSVTCTAKGQPGINVKIKVMKNGKKAEIQSPGDSIHSVSNSSNHGDQIVAEKKITMKVSYDVREFLSLYTCRPVGPSYEMRGFNCSGKYFCEAGYTDPLIGMGVEKEFVVVLKDFLTFPRPPIVITLNPNSRSVYVEWKIPSFGDIPITKYKVVYKLKSTRGLVFQDGPTVNVTKTSVTMHSLAPYTDYNIMIVAYLPDDVKRFTPSKSAKIQSSIFRFKTDVAGPSAAPVTVEIVRFTSRTVEMTWQEPPSATWNGPLDGYGVFYTRIEYGGSSLNSEPRQSKLSNGKSLSISLVNLVPWSSYVIELYAFNIKEDGTPALGVMKNITVQTNVDAPSKPPIGLGFLVSDSESATFKWQPPLMKQANGPVDGYFITYEKIRVGNLPVQNPVKMKKQVNKSDISGYILQGLSSWCTYRVTVAAYNDFRGKPRISPQSPYLQAQTQVNEPAVSSRNLTVREVKSRSVLLVWKPPLAHVANGPIDGYIVYYRRLKMGQKPLSNIRFRTKPVQRFDHTGYSLDGLIPWSTYDIRLSAYNHLGDRYLYSKEKESIVVDTTVDRPASPPEKLKNITIGSDQVELSWESPPVDDCYGPIDGYRLLMKRLKVGPYEIIGEVEQAMDINRTKTGPWVIPNLSPWTTYSIRVSAFNVRDGIKLLSHPSNKIEIVTEMAKPYGSPSKVKVSVTSPTSFSVSWEEPALEDRNGIIEGYVIRLNTTTGDRKRVKRSAVGQSKIIITTGEQRKHDVTNLYADTTYSIEVACYTGAGRGPFGAAVYKKTEEDAPSAPMKPRIVDDEDEFKTVSWDMPDEPNGRIRRYEVELLKLGVNTSKVESVNGNTFDLNITQLEENMGYLFRVRAVTVKKGKWSNWKTLVAPPPNSVERADKETSKKRLIMIIVLACLVLVLIVLVVLYLARRRRLAKARRAGKGQKETEIELLAGEQALSETLDSDDFGIEGEAESAVSHSTDSLQNDVKVDKLDANPPSSISNDPRHPSIPLGKFSNHVLLLKEDNRRKLRDEFKEFKVGQVYCWNNALTDENRWKNRYANIVAYDHSRVILKPLSTMPGGTDYINATYIDSYSRAKAYIVTQGPLDSTTMDFWQMVWNEKATVIVALTRLEEGGKSKCHQYWPSDVDNTASYGDINVAVLSIDQTADYVINSFEVSKDGIAESRLVYHFHFLSWPDHGTPDYPTALLSLRRRVRHHMSPKVPLIVHCSAGVGRSGCFILVDAMLEKITKEKEGSIDIYNYMHFLRSRRINMVQTEDQYEFVHDAILEAVTCGNTEIPLDELPKIMKKFRETASLGEKNGFEKEYLRLTQNCPDVKPEHCMGALKPCNIKKNRNLDVLPKDSARVYLTPMPGDFDTSYINAVHADGYRERGLFILAEAPMKHMIASFWQMVQERQCNTIVMLNCLREFAEVYPRIWPMEESPAVEEFGDFTVEMLSEQMDGDLMSRRLRLLSNQGSFEPREIQLYQYLAWPYRDIPESRRDILNLISRVEGAQRRLGNNPVVITCSDGAGRSGTFVSVYNSIERVKVEQLIDVFQCVRSLRIVRQTAVATSDQYTFIYDMIAEYLDSFDTYANFH